MFIFQTNSLEEDIVVISSGILSLYKSSYMKINIRDINGKVSTINYSTQTDRDNDFERLKKELSVLTQPIIIQNNKEVPGW